MPSNLGESRRAAPLGTECVNLGLPEQSYPNMFLQYTMFKRLSRRFHEISMNCPSCEMLLAERGFYCQACGSQARCMNCRDVLERGAVACVECGTRVGMRNGNADTAGSVASCTPATNPSANRNTLKYKEDRNSRSFEASLTDSAMQGVAGVLQDVFTRAGARPPVITRHERQPDVIEVRGQLPPPSGQEEECLPLPPGLRQTVKTQLAVG